MPWAQVNKAVFQIYAGRGRRIYFRVDVTGWMFTWQSRDLCKMKSEMVFRAVLERVAPRHIWPAR